MSETTRARVLIVEDQRDVADLYETWLADEYAVRTANSGSAALQSVTERDTDVVLLDRQMPGLSGDEVARRLYESEYGGQVVMVTAISPSLDVAALPIDDYATKPLDREQLHAVVETAVLARRYDDEVTELLALVNRRCALETEFSRDELAASAEFDRLTTRITTVQESVDEAVDDLWRRSDTDVFARMAERFDDTAQSS